MKSKISIVLILLLTIIILNGCSGRVATKTNLTVMEEWYRNSDNKESKMLRGSMKDYTASSDNYIIKLIDWQENLIPAKDLWRIEGSDKQWNNYETEEEYVKKYSDKETILKKVKGWLDHCVFRDDYEDQNVNLDKLERDRKIWGADYYPNVELNPEELEKIRQKRGVDYVETCYDSNRESPMEWYLEVSDKNWVSDWVNNWEHDETKFHYIKDKNGAFIKKSHIGTNAFAKYTYVAVKECFKDGWCELYPSIFKNIHSTFYVKEKALLSIEGLENILNNYIKIEEEKR